jgi:N-acetylornithine carbamoyltransferase
MITTQEWTKDELDTIIDVALDLKRRRALGEQHPLLDNKVLAMLFFFSSTRTRASFEAGMAQLGGHAMFLDSTSTQIGHGDTWKEIGFDQNNEPVAQSTSYFRDDLLRFRLIRRKSGA